MQTVPGTKQGLYTLQTTRLYLKATAPYKKDILLSCLLPASNVVLGVAVPFLASKILAGVVSHGPMVWQDFSWFVGAVVVGAILNVIGIRTCVKLQAVVMEDLHLSMFRQLLGRSVGFYSNQIGGKLVSDAIDFIAAYGQLFNAAFINMVGFILTTFIGLCVIFISNWIIGLAVSVLMAGLVFWTVVATEKRTGLRIARQTLGKRVTGHLSDNIVNAITVKTFAQEKAELARSRDYNRELKHTRIDDWQRTVTSESNRMSVLLTMQVVLVLVLILTIDSHTHLLATGIFAFTYTLTLINRFFSIITTFKQIDDSLLQASSMTGVLLQQTEVQDAPDAKALTIGRGEVTLADVRFRYADTPGNEYIFDGLSLAIKAGEKIGLVGHSGGGKSTLTRLLLRFDDIDSGSISIDGQDISRVTQTSLRKHIGYVPQEPLLFHRSIRENIAYGKPKATQKEIEEAASLAYAHDFIMKLPEGYDTVVGERGVKLSGGQRQRIAIARAMLKNAPILVLDEATSALDSESEKAIQKALWKLMSGKTAVVIAHRLSTIQKMDRILVLDDGKIVEEGSHKELLEKDGLYARLWAHQSGGFIEE
ncbi:MAG TPA: ABC transporter ATP-binding protein [Candidatus Saccharimonadales bacterium]|nr:ABC transporter ATP-binding protein [Candidatus Saccharimonadales bacterium]